MSTLGSGLNGGDGRGPGGAATVGGMVVRGGRRASMTLRPGGVGGGGGGGGGRRGLESGARDYLDPDSDGMLLTADGYIVHMRWQVTYRRTADSRSLESIASDGAAGGADQAAVEKQIVAAAIRRGVLHAAAGMTVDE